MKYQQIKRSEIRKQTGLGIGQAPNRKKHDCVFRAISVLLGIDKDQIKTEYKKLCPNSRGRGVRIDLISQLMKKYGFTLKDGYLNLNRRPDMFHTTGILNQMEKLKEGILITSRHAIAFKDNTYFDTSDMLSDDSSLGVRGYFIKQNTEGNLCN